MVIHSKHASAADIRFIGGQMVIHSKLVSAADTTQGQIINLSKVHKKIPIIFYCSIDIRENQTETTTCNLESIA